MSTSVPITLSAEAIDDLIYDARAGDLEALNEDVANLANQHSCNESQIVASAIDLAEQSEGGSGSCVLHFPAANGNIKILNALLQKLSAADAAQRSALVNHRNYSGNTPLHWAALNTHLECVKALVGAGADLTVKNDAGHDAVFLAERKAWEALEKDAQEGEGQGEGEDQDQEIEMTIGGEEGEGEVKDAGEMSAGRQVVEWLLASDVAASLEKGATEGSASGERSASA
ncbi:hypothetical protein PENANT_c004G03994 [Penicillium antarcticum]|uniref:Uncharacterized protein n=1 Tax=Penicillium antarcticum TaxID=416450 RepID=A0A1V6QHC4_9EURO|nr:uncharacterized protein N7508_002211 [Penicillium antarcticum]KAJ5317703.1 hypothetical protein N7508_002211 [Penicillium antarcticum]OQD88357.1 hypothetical protein PENANT_c004G03994 [Penicillium antarcticum]